MIRDVIQTGRRMQSNELWMAQPKRFRSSRPLQISRPNERHPSTVAFQQESYSDLSISRSKLPSASLLEMPIASKRNHTIAAMADCDRWLRGVTRTQLTADVSNGSRGVSGVRLVELVMKTGVYQRLIWLIDKIERDLGSTTTIEPLFSTIVASSSRGTC
jgi:hypothetical protein